MSNTLIQGNLHSFNTVQVSAAGTDFPAGTFKSINWKVQKDPGMVYGQGQAAPRGKTQGTFTGSGSFEILASDWVSFIQNLVAAQQIPSGYTDADFDITIRYNLNDVDVITYQLRGCRISGVDNSNTQSNDATYKSVDFVYMQEQVSSNYGGPSVNAYA